jgi:hypothetical protein
MISQAASDHPTGRKNDPMVEKLVQQMKQDGIPLTRDNYLHVAYFGETPDPWTPEHEADLPVELQDFSRFK